MNRSIVCIAVVAALALIATAEGAEEGKGTKPKSVTAPIEKIDGATVMLVRRGDSGESQVSTTLTTDTEIVVETDEDTTVAGEGGEQRKRPKTRAGAAAELKEGQRVSVAYKEDGSAVRILVLRPAPKRTGGEGDK